ncbi:MAG: hypothetical protein AAB316_12665, partial [Bacteroidota bacterium]
TAHQTAQFLCEDDKSDLQTCRRHTRRHSSSARMTKATCRLADGTRSTYQKLIDKLLSQTCYTITYRDCRLPHILRPQTDKQAAGQPLHFSIKN